MLNVQDITVTYSQNPRPTIEGFHLQMKPGEICSIVGESGSGKTTVIRSILGVLPGGGKVTKGDILFEGESLLHYSKAVERFKRDSDFHDFSECWGNDKSCPQNWEPVCGVYPRA